MAIVIDKNIPVPANDGRRSEVTQALCAMEVGQSFLVPKRPHAPSIYRLKPKRFVTKTVEGGIRVWRVA